MMDKKKILIVDDDENIAELISLYLIKECFDTEISDNGEDALAKFKTYKPNLILLDIMLPGMDGYDVCREIRKSSNVPIIMLSAKGEVFDKVLGLKIGADDYIEKPYDIDILLAKIRGIFKRKFSIDEIVDGELKLNCATKTLYVAGELKEVTAKEFDLLKLLIDNKGVTLKKAFIFNSIWGSDSESEMQTLNVHIKWLREKIEKDPKNPSRILTVWGVGYRFE
jgi:DNA-binding response OmpR family regulator